MTNNMTEKCAFKIDISKTASPAWNDQFNFNNNIINEKEKEKEKENEKEKEKEN